MAPLAPAADLRCLLAHATHPDARMAMALAAAQIEAQRSASGGAGLAPGQAVLGLMYLTEPFAAAAEALLAEARGRWPGVQWVGASGIGVIAGGAEYFDEPGLALLWIEAPAGSFHLFHGRQPLPEGVAEAALVHADPATPDLAELIAELAGRTRQGYLFGGLACGQSRQVHLADGVYAAGLSGVGFGPEIALLSRVTQGCQPVGPARRITAVQDHVVLELDGRPALPQVLADLGLSLDRPREALFGLRRTLLGLADGDAAALVRGQFGADTRVRHLIGIDPAREAIAIADRPEPGWQLTCCRRDAEAARRDLVRICAELRDALDPESDGLDADPGAQAQAQHRPAGPAPRIAAAVYVSCSGRGGPHFGAPSAEAQIVQHALGPEVPVIGFFAGGEIAHHHLYGYTGVLTAFVTPGPRGGLPAR